MTGRLVAAGSSGELISCQYSRLTGPRCARYFSMTAALRRGRQMAAIKSVMLLPQDEVIYRRHIAHHTFLAKVNSDTKIPDTKIPDS